MASPAGLSVDSTRPSDLCVCVWIAELNWKQNKDTWSPLLELIKTCSTISQCSLKSLHSHQWHQKGLSRSWASHCQFHQHNCGRKKNYILFVLKINSWQVYEVGPNKRNAYLKTHFVLSKVTARSLVSATQNSIKTESLLSYHLAVAGCLWRNMEKFKLLHTKPASINAFISHHF